LEKHAIRLKIRYREANTNEIMILGEKGFDRLAADETVSRNGCHGYRTGCYDQDTGEYWWIFMTGHDPHPNTTNLISNNID
jgi:hypothetical protein